jgi:hypothetical protein
MLQADPDRACSGHVDEEIDTASALIRDVTVWVIVATVITAGRRGRELSSG